MAAKQQAGEADAAGFTQDAVRFAEWVKAHAPGFATIEIAHPEIAGEKVPVLVSVGETGASLIALRKYQAEYRTRPERREGLAEMLDLDSFIAHVLRFRDPGSAIFADTSDPKQPKLVAVLDYHQASNDRIPVGRLLAQDALRRLETATVADPREPDDAEAEAAMMAARNALGELLTDPAAMDPALVDRVVAEALPRHGKHRTLYRFPLSDEWKAWTDNDGESMTQADFAAFLEDRIGDVIPPPTETDIAAAGQAAAEAAARGESKMCGMNMMQLAHLLGGRFAGASKLLELSRGLAVHQSERVKQATNLDTGEIQVQYEAEHQNEQGGPIKVPNLFLIGIPVFRAGVPYQIAVRLRYRVQGGAVRWHYQLYRADVVFDHAFREAATRAETETRLPLFIGKPETATQQ